jgi:hypothetical protein
MPDVSQTIVISIEKYHNFRQMLRIPGGSRESNLQHAPEGGSCNGRDFHPGHGGVAYEKW